MSDAFQLRCFGGTQSAPSIPRRDIAVSSVSLVQGSTRLAGGAGRDALYVDLLSDAIAHSARAREPDSQDVLETVESTIRVADEGARKLAWIDNVYSLVAKEQTDAATDMLLGRFNTMLEHAEFEQCDSALRAFDFKRLNTTLMVSILSITRPATSKLKARSEVLVEIERVLTERVPDRASRLLKNLR